MNTAFIVLGFTLGFAAFPFYEFPKSLIPVDGCITDNLAGAFVKPRGQLFIFELCGFLVNRRISTNGIIFIGKGCVITLLIAFCIPYLARTSHPLTQYQLLTACWICF